MAEIIVTKEIVNEVVEKLKNEKLLVVDTETTGLKPYLNSKIFSVQISTEQDDYYFNLNDQVEDEFRGTLLKAEDLLPLFRCPDISWVGQNLKFDLHFLDGINCFPCGSKLYDTEVLGRLFDHNFFKYSLEEMGQRHLGVGKDPKVLEWMEENKCYTLERAPFKEDLNKNYHYNMVPFPLITAYGMRDTRLTLDLFKFFMNGIDPRSKPVIELESQLIPVLYKMEKVGIKIDVYYVDAAIEHEEDIIKDVKKKFLKETGLELKDSAEFLGPLFESHGYLLPKTETGALSATDEVLSSIDLESARLVLKYREHHKRLHTYFLSFLYFSDYQRNVHCQFFQAGTNTGRISSRNPNLQNIPSEDDSRYPVRRAFIPRDDFMFVSIDYKQMEFRLMLDYANESTLIDKIKQGLDPHDATAEETGLDRKAAKTLNFGIIYGMGLEKIGKAIGVTKDKAKEFKWQYFARLPRVKQFIRAVSDKWEREGKIYNWLGRCYTLEDKRWSYKGPNKLIQGGTADIVKTAMVSLDKFLEDKKSRMLLQVHDEILFEVRYSEIGIVGELQRLMESAYPYKHIPLTTSISFSLKSFGEMQEVNSLDEFQEAARKALSEKGYKLS